MDVPRNKSLPQKKGRISALMPDWSGGGWPLSQPSCQAYHMVTVNNLWISLLSGLSGCTTDGGKLCVDVDLIDGQPKNGSVSEQDARIRKMCETLHNVVDGDFDMLLTTTSLAGSKRYTCSLHTK